LNSSAFIGRYNRFKLDFRGYSFAKFYGFRMESITFPGYLRVDLNDWVGGIFSAIVNIQGQQYNANSRISGDITNWTTVIAVATNSFFVYYDNNVIGNMYNITFLQNPVTISFYECGLTGLLRTWKTSLATVNFLNNNCNTAELDAFLSFLNTFYATNTPIKNLSLVLGGADMGIPTGGASNTDLLGIVAKFVAAGFTATITVRTS